jgi:predicted metal-dependent RNase
MLGSASIQLIVEEAGKTKRVVFSGDLGPRSAPILREFEPFQQADLVFLESTYGGRDHRSFVDTVVEFERIVMDAVNRGGKMLVPTFAVGRATDHVAAWQNVPRRKGKTFSDLPRQPDGDRSNEHLRQAHGAFR